VLARGRHAAYETAELTQAGAERFYEAFYFQYGHASIADLAHLTMVVENVSIVAAIELLDEPLFDAQEGVTRYQDFTKRRYYTPPKEYGTFFEQFNAPPAIPCSRPTAPPPARLPSASSTATPTNGRRRSATTSTAAPCPARLHRQRFISSELERLTLATI
jgi:hypothetical protein